MSKTFFCIKQGDRLSLRPLPGKVCESNLIDSPCFSFYTSPGALMNVNPLYKDVPFLQEKLKILKQMISHDKSTIARWEAEDPPYELLPKVKEQLARNEKLLKEMEEALRCQ